jgi:hypothetical protein
MNWFLKKERVMTNLYCNERGRKLKVEKGSRGQDISRISNERFSKAGLQVRSNNI